jgi:acyl dehydratase
MAQWLEDIELGNRIELGPWVMDAEEMIAFARKYDPQPFHIDPVAAAQSHFGGIIASGWFTIACWMRAMMKHRNEQNLKYAPPETETPGPKPQNGPSPGFINLSWPNPVRPGDVISFSATTAEKLVMKSRPGWGIIRSTNEGFNQNGELVLRFTGQGMVSRKS